MISPATVGDLLTFRRKPQHVVLLYTERMLARPHRLGMWALRSVVEGVARDSTTLVLRERGTRAFVQARGRAGRPEQDIIALARYGNATSPSTPDVWYRLIEAHCAQAGHMGVQRLFAAVPHHHEELREVFRQLSFACYTQQIVMRLEGPDWDQGTTIAPMREQTRRDIWAIHKLYGGTTPRPVQMQEARDSRTWAMRRMPRRTIRQRGWVLGPQDDLVAALQLTSGPNAHVITFLLKTDTRDITTDVLRFALGQIPDAAPVYLLLRDYQRELLLPAGDLGFQPIGEQSLYARHLTETVRRPLLIPGFDRGAEFGAPIPRIVGGGELHDV